MRRPGGRGQNAAAVAALAAALARHGRGEPVRAIEALAAVVVNRMRAARAGRAPAAWGGDLAAALAAAGLATTPGEAEQAPQALAEACRRIAARAASGALPDPTGGALCWHRAGSAPPVDAPAGEAVRLGGLVFIRPAAAAARAGDRLA